MTRRRVCYFDETIRGSSGEEFAAGFQNLEDWLRSLSVWSLIQVNNYRENNFCPPCRLNLPDAILVNASRLREASAAQFVKPTSGLLRAAAVPAGFESPCGTRLFGFAIQSSNRMS